MNAVAVAHGFAQAALQQLNPRDAQPLAAPGAPDADAAVGGRGDAGQPDVGRAAAGQPVWLMSQWLSPYQTNPLGINPAAPLERRWTSMPCAMRASNGCVPGVFVCATNVRTGRVARSSGQRLSAMR